jgi:hypothetical protein
VDIPQIFICPSSIDYNPHSNIQFSADIDAHRASDVAVMVQASIWEEPDPNLAEFNRLASGFHSLPQSLPVDTEL